MLSPTSRSSRLFVRAFMLEVYSTVDGSPRQQMFIFRDLWAWLDNPMEGPPAARQLAEQLPMPLTW